MGTGGRGIISALWSSGLADIRCRGRDRDLYGFFEVGGDVMLTSGALFFIVIFYAFGGDIGVSIFHQT